MNNQRKHKKPKVNGDKLRRKHAVVDQPRDDGTDEDVTEQTMSASGSESKGKSATDDFLTEDFNRLGTETSNTRMPQTENPKEEGSRNWERKTGEAVSWHAAQASRDTLPDSAAEALNNEWPLFQKLDKEKLQLIRTRAILKRFRSGTMLISMGLSGTGVYVLLEGTVKIFVSGDDGDEVIIALAGPGDLLGELDAIDDQGHSAYVMTLEPCLALWFSVEEFWRLQQEIPQLSRNLLTILAQRERRSTGRSSALAKLDLTGRVARQLLIFAQLYGVREMNGIVLPLRLNQTEIAALVGSSRGSVNRVLSGFKSRKYIVVASDGRITLCNVTALVALCQGLSS